MVGAHEASAENDEDVESCRFYESASARKRIMHRNKERGQLTSQKLLNKIVLFVELSCDPTIFYTECITVRY